MKIVGVYPDSFEASLARGRLEEAGIEVCLLNEYINSVIPYAPQEEREVKLGRSSQSGGGLGKGKVCPFCGSERVTFGLKGPSRWKKIATAVVETLTMAPAGNLRCLYYCQDCKREF